MQSIRIGGKILEYEWHGPAPGDSVTMIFLHEGLGCLAQWRDFPRRLSESTGHSAFVFSRAGYGNSDPAALPRSVRFMHEEALLIPQIISEMNIRETVLIGHSDGASISLIYAGSRPATPVHALVLMAPHVFVEDITVESIAAAKAEYRNGELRDRLQKHHRNVDNMFLGWTDVWLRPEFRFWNIEEYLRQIRVPILVMQGEEDRFGTQRQVEAIGNACPDPVESVILSGCGHRPHREKTEETIDAVADFLGRVVKV